jgi:Domain of unknown function (DUF4440)
MSRIIVAAVVACSILHVGLVTAQTASDRTAVQKQVVAHEKAIIDAIVKNDPKTFHSYVLPDSFAMSGEGVVKAAEFDKMMSQMQADCKFTKWSLTDSTFYWVNDNTVIHMYKVTGDATCKGQPVPPTWNSSVWTNKGGKWLGAFHHESAVVTPPGTPKK